MKCARKIAENPCVTPVIDEYQDDWSQLAWVIAQGNAAKFLKVKTQ